MNTTEFTLSASLAAGKAVCRDDSVATIERVIDDPLESMPVRGQAIVGDKKMPACWTSEGKWKLNGSEHPLDLVGVPVAEPAPIPYDPEPYPVTVKEDQMHEEDLYHAHNEILRKDRNNLVEERNSLRAEVAGLKATNMKIREEFAGMISDACAENARLREGLSALIAALHTIHPDNQTFSVADAADKSRALLGGEG